MQRGNACRRKTCQQTTSLTRCIPSLWVSSAWLGSRLNVLIVGTFVRIIHPQSLAIVGMSPSTVEPIITLQNRLRLCRAGQWYAALPVLLFVGSTFCMHRGNHPRSSGAACRFIGVSRIMIFARDGERGSIARAVASHFPPAFLSWAELPVSMDAGGAGGAATYTRLQCLQQYRGLYAFVTYLGTLDYLMVRGAERGVQGGLEKVLMQRELRYAPGAPHSLQASEGAVPQHHYCLAPSCWQGTSSMLKSMSIAMHKWNILETLCRRGLPANTNAAVCFAANFVWHCL
jgi:hypothetical protein